MDRQDDPRETAAMIRVSLELGVISTCSGDDLLDQISVLGDKLGFLFQLTDDILDVSGSTEEMGKRVSKDAEQDKSNPVSMMGIEKAAALADKMAGISKMSLPHSGVTGAVFLILLSICLIEGAS